MKPQSISPSSCQGAEPVPWSAAPFNPLDTAVAPIAQGGSFKQQPGLVSKTDRDDDDQPFTD
jgi:hypothetical protein